MNKTVLKLAAQLDAKFQKDYADYLEECEQWHREGYRAHYCEHGTNLWTDYDNICGPCEDGLSMSDGLFRMAYAISEAKNRWEKANEIIEFVTAAKAKGFDSFVDAEKAFELFARWITV